MGLDGPIPSAEVPQMVFRQPDLNTIGSVHPQCVVPQCLLEDAVAFSSTDSGCTSTNAAVFVPEPAAHVDVLDPIPGRIAEHSP